MVDKDVILRKLYELERYAKELERYRQYPFNDLTSSLEREWSIEHGLQLSIQIVIDIGNHILAANGERQINDTDVIDKLGERDIIPLEFAQTIRNMAGFRNILVHEYISIDLQEVYDVLQDQLEDFQKFIQYITGYLSKSVANGSQV